MKRFKLVTLMAFVVVLGFGLTSCGGYSNSKAKEFIKSYDKDPDKLKKDDYATMIEWYEDIQTEYLDRWEKVAKDEKKYIDYKLALEELQADFASDYPHYMHLVVILASADEDAMGKANYKKFEKLEEKFDKREEKIKKKAPERDDD